MAPVSLCTLDQKATLPLPEVRSTCNEIGDSLAKACVALDWRGSLVRVQHLLYAAIKFPCEGRMDKYWEGIARASQAAQKAEIHCSRPSVSNDWDMETEMRRRVLCSLYIFDR